MEALRNSVALCEICEREFTEDFDLIPRILTECGHTLCSECVTKICDGNKTILCPFDRIETTIPEGDVKKLKKNFSILRLKEEEQFQIRQRTTEKREKKTRRNDGTCDENMFHRAENHCKSCDADLCDECWNWIHSLSILAHHEKSEMFRKPIEAPFCEIHNDQKAAFVCSEEACKKLEKRLMCHLCYQEENNIHFNHGFVDLESDVIDLRTKIMNALKTAEEKAAAIFTNISKLDDVKSTYNVLSSAFNEKVLEVRRFRYFPPDEGDIIEWRLKEGVEERVDRLKQRIANQKADADWIRKNKASVERLMTMVNTKLVAMRWEVDMLVARIQGFHVRHPKSLVPFKNSVIHTPSLKPLKLEIQPIHRLEVRDNTNKLADFINKNSSVVSLKTKMRRYKSHYFRLLNEQSEDNRVVSEGLSLLIVVDPFNGDHERQTDALNLLANADAYENIIIGLTPFNFQEVSTFLAKLVNIGDNDSRVRMVYINDPEKDLKSMVESAFKQRDEHLQNPPAL